MDWMRIHRVRVYLEADFEGEAEECGHCVFDFEGGGKRARLSVDEEENYRRKYRMLKYQVCEV